LVLCSLMFGEQIPRPLKTLSVFGWTVIFIIALFFVDKNERK
jgi:hypothetical protein